MRSRAAVAALLLAVLLSLVAQATPGGADEAGETWRERQRVREQQEAVGADLDVLTAQDAELEAALTRLEAELAAEEARLAAARRAATEASIRLAMATAQVDRTTARVEEQEARLRQLAIEAYIGSGLTDDMVVVLAAEDLEEAARRTTVIDVVATDMDAVLAELEETRRTLERLRRRADDAADAASDLRAEAEASHAAVQAARDTHAAFAAEVAARIERRLAEAAALAALDAELGAELQAQQVALVARTRGAGGGLAGGDLVRPDELTRVRGFTVHVSIADSFDAMLTAAEEDGISLGGGAYRSRAEQILLRQAHCPDVWMSPPSECLPPTARPGLSLHELGLAVDFTYGGAVISTPASPAFRWLAANAATYGFRNLPSEPWHWSTTGD